MKILLFGGKGQLGLEISKRGQDLNFEIVSPVSSEIDISDRDQVLFLTEKVKPSLVINAAAYTAVDKAEDEVDKAFLINRDGAGYVAEAAKNNNARLFHVSTDYVFDGTGSTPLTEDSPTKPLSVYGQSKLEGEQAVFKAFGSKALVIRISSLHGQYGNNFIHTMLRLFSERDQIKVVSDQRMSPTWAGWLAEVMLDLSRIKSQGILHACSKGETTWYELASATFEIAAPFIKGAENTKIDPIPASDYPTPAKRPMYSVLDCSKLTGLLGRESMDWREGLSLHLKELGYPPDEFGKRDN
ncbi:MAG: dTDP-4-dehydrorhamnose reductase [Bdellovibrionota bacterium]